MNIVFELNKTPTGWILISHGRIASAESYFTSRRKALMSVIRRIELVKPTHHFTLTLEDVKNEEEKVYH